ncbi:chemotaxis protein CheC [Cohnella sp. LGH]|uniref:Chemotaxis protein CheC n=1 Tax=Cohnella phaseoli TaxID=456490 RepID=A0A3D9KIP8_9BACL|nr:MULTISPECIES: chemotaxis protein CheC [Cohnella]QTH45884.1 chemotaxis protein CheC [Cohnella sp. LGH]RED86421.1 chemotaxis protein CheC [Cohnella phaseoli]
MKLFRNDEAFKLDVLREVGNIGAGNAATALSTLLNKPVDMAVPTVNLLPFEAIAERVGGSEAVVIAIFLRVEGDAPGNMFFIISREQARRLLRDLLGFSAGENEEYSELELSALNEIGNILAGSYLSSLADFTGLRMSPTVPSLAVDMAGAILSYGLLQFGTMGDDALLIETTFLEGQQEAEGHFFLIPDPESFEKLFRALGVPI